MLGWLTRTIDGTKRRLDFMGVERRLRRATHAEAADRFATAAFEAELAACKADLAAASAARFDTAIADADHTCAIVMAGIGRLSVDLALWSRPLARDLAERREAHAATKARLSEAYADRDAAYEAMDAATASVRHWHNSAQSELPIYGKRGKPIPRHSLLGMSHGDLAAAQRDRSGASDDIGAAKREVATLKQSLSDIGAEIGALKAAKARLKHLKEQGQSPATIGAAIDAERSQLATRRAALAALNEERRYFETESEPARTIAALDARITRIRAEKHAFLTAFREAREDRRRAHAAAWGH